MKRFLKIFMFSSLIFSKVSVFAQLSEVVSEAKSAINKLGKLTTSTSSPTPYKSIVHSKFDFIPGDSILFADDFSSYPIGSMPKTWKSTKSGKMVTLDGFSGQWLGMDDATTYKIVKPIAIPEKATIEFDLIAAAEKITDLNGELSFGLSKDNSAIVYVYQNKGLFNTSLWYMTGVGYQIKSNSTGINAQGQFDLESYVNQKMHISINIDHQTVQIYLDKTKIADTKLLDNENKSKYFYLSTQNASFHDAKVMIGNVRIATFKDKK